MGYQHCYTISIWSKDWESLIEIEQSLPTAHVHKDPTQQYQFLEKKRKREQKMEKQTFIVFMTSFCCLKAYKERE